MDGLKALSRENHDPKFPPALFQDIPQHIADTEQRLRLCRTEIVRIECLLDTLYIQQEALETQLELYASLRAPIRSLPVMLLQTILLETELQPTVLSQVCSHWRNVIVDSPIYWSNFDLGKKMWQLPDSNETLDYFLSRTRSHPLSVSIIKNYGPEPARAWDRFRLLSQRCGALSLELTEGSGGFDELRELKFPALHTLSVDALNQWGNAPHEIMSLSTFCQAPVLQNITLSGIRLSIAELPWEQLLKLDLHSVPFGQQETYILSLCRQLQTLVLSHCSMDRGTSLEPWTLSIGELKVDKVSVRPLLPQCPHLVSLHLGSFHHDRRHPWTEIDPHESTEDIMRTRILIAYGATIQTLCLDSENLLPFISLLEDELRKPQSKVPLPNLRNLSLGLELFIADEALQRLHPLIQVRSKMGFQQLQMCVFVRQLGSWGRPPEDTPLPLDLAPLRSLVMSGIIVKLTHEMVRDAWTGRPPLACRIWHVLQAEESDGIEGEQIACLSATNSEFLRLNEGSWWSHQSKSQRRFFSW